MNIDNLSFRDRAKHRWLKPLSYAALSTAIAIGGAMAGYKLLNQTSQEPTTADLTQVLPEHLQNRIYSPFLPPPLNERAHDPTTQELDEAFAKGEQSASTQETTQQTRPYTSAERINDQKHCVASGTLTNDTNLESFIDAGCNSVEFTQPYTVQAGDTLTSIFNNKLGKDSGYNIESMKWTTTKNDIKDDLRIDTCPEEMNKVYWTQKSDGLGDRIFTGQDLTLGVVFHEQAQADFSNKTFLNKAHEPTTCDYKCKQEKQAPETEKAAPPEQEEAPPQRTPSIPQPQPAPITSCLDDFLTQEHHKTNGYHRADFREEEEGDILYKSDNNRIWLSTDQGAYKDSNLDGLLDKAIIFDNNTLDERDEAIRTKNYTTSSLAPNQAKNIQQEYNQLIRQIEADLKKEYDDSCVPAIVEEQQSVVHTEETPKELVVEEEVRRGSPAVVREERRVAPQTTYVQGQPRSQPVVMTSAPMSIGFSYSRTDITTHSRGGHQPIHHRPIYQRSPCRGAGWQHCRPPRGALAGRINPQIGFDVRQRSGYGWSHRNRQAPFNPQMGFDIRQRSSQGWSHRDRSASFKPQGSVYIQQRSQQPNWSVQRANNRAHYHRGGR